MSQIIKQKEKKNYNFSKILLQLYFQENCTHNAGKTIQRIK